MVFQAREVYRGSRGEMAFPDEWVYQERQVDPVRGEFPANPGLKDPQEEVVYQGNVRSHGQTHHQAVLV